MFKGLVIGLLFNAEVGGDTARYIHQSMKDMGAQVQLIDYRKIATPYENLSELQEVYGPEAKDLFLQECRKKAGPFMEDIHGIILPGNAKSIDPELYGGERDEPPGHYDLSRSLAEIAVLSIAFRQGLPTLAVCGGLEILNVFLGGTLRKLTPEELEIHGEKTTGEVCLKPSSTLAKTLDVEGVTVWGAHQWIIDKLGGKEWINPFQHHPSHYLEIVAYADDELGNPEVVESTVGVPRVGLQCHPEVLLQQQMIKKKPENASFAVQDLSKRTLKDNKKILSTFLESAETNRLKRNVLRELKSQIPVKDP